MQPPKLDSLPMLGRVARISTCICLTHLLNLATLGLGWSLCACRSSVGPPPSLSLSLSLSLSVPEPHVCSKDGGYAF